MGAGGAACLVSYLLYLSLCGHFMPLGTCHAMPASATASLPLGQGGGRKEGENKHAMCSWRLTASLPLLTYGRSSHFASPLLSSCPTSCLDSVFLYVYHAYSCGELSKMEGKELPQRAGGLDSGTCVPGKPCGRTGAGAEEEGTGRSLITMPSFPSAAGTPPISACRHFLPILIYSHSMPVAFSVLEVGGFLLWWVVEGERRHSLPTLSVEEEGTCGGEGGEEALPARHFAAFCTLSFLLVLFWRWGGGWVGGFHGLPFLPSWHARLGHASPSPRAVSLEGGGKVGRDAWLPSLAPTTFLSPFL